MIDTNGKIMWESSYLYINDTTKKKTNLGELLSVYTYKKGAKEYNKDRPKVLKHKIVPCEIKFKVK